MPDALERTFGGATRALIAALGFILLTVGIGMMTDKAGAQFQFGLFLLYLALFVGFFGSFGKAQKKFSQPKR